MRIGVALLRLCQGVGVLGAVAASAAIAFSLFHHENPYADSFAHFRAHIGATLVLTATALAVLRLRRMAVLFAIIGLAGVAISLIAVVPFGGSAAAGGNAVRLFTLNLNYANTDRHAIIDRIEEARPDVMMLQEVSSRHDGLIQTLSGAYSLAADCRRAPYGMVILIRRQSITSGPSGCDPGDAMAWAEAKIGERAVALVSLHLHWPAPYAQNDDVRRLTPTLTALPRPLLVAGDFNAAPWSATVARINKVAGTHLAPGYRPSWAPGLPNGLADLIGLPIDHVLISEGMQPGDVRLLDPVGSDHRPLLAEIHLQ